MIGLVVRPICLVICLVALGSVNDALNTNPRQWASYCIANFLAGYTGEPPIKLGGDNAVAND